MATTFRLIVASVGETLFDGAAASVTLPGAGGELTVLAHHEPLVSTLKAGTISIKLNDDSRKNFDISDGILECNGERVTVLL